MLHINEDKNILLFDDKEYNKDFNYLPLLVSGFSRLNPKQTIHFGIDLDETPAGFILYVQRILETVKNINQLILYFKEDSPGFIESLTASNLKWHSIKDLYELSHNKRISLNK